ncbi:MAG: bifunctional phosphopantothenoylcysteine decarboxylase/phosphopantothenate--cysteine ligase CoaBC [Bacteriovoracaceae bacterium]|nr:bifunctional phosphopantothenoylcysteine decarboxylase/phosphopantothenate--cysteine ligase CoaBC [Bacteriovoracaceae bacterium]
MKIALGVTGSISAYKAFDLVRIFIKEGHQVRVILTKGALQFIKKETFLYLGCVAVYGPEEDFSSRSSQDQELLGPVLHVALAKWADVGLIAPLSANTLATFCQALAPDLLSSLFLAWRKEKPLLVYPAMNTEMMGHPFVQDNLRKIKELPNIFLGNTQRGELACGDIGEGKLEDIEIIAKLTKTYNMIQNEKKVLITTGATVAPLDSVRYLTNASSGKTSVPFIEECLQRGLGVTVIAGIFATKELDHFNDHPKFKLIRIKTTNDMRQQVIHFFPECDLYISSAAIGDFEFTQFNGKLKKAQMNDHLSIKESPDILKEVLSLKKEHQKVIGFAAEASLDEVILQEKYQRKPVDLLVATEVNNGLTSDKMITGFQNDRANYRFMTKDSLTETTSLSKREMAAFALLNLLDESNEALH